MSQIYAYEREPYLKELDIEVVEIGEDDGRAFAVLDDTILYPEGGGQPADRGRLGDVQIVDTQRVGGAIRHYLDTPALEGPSMLTLDWDRRFDHMQQHTAQHLLTAIAADRFGWETTSFHLGATVCDIELDVRSTSPTELDALEEACMEAVRASLKVSGRRLPPEEYASLEVRSRGLPASHRGDVRLVEIEGIDLTTCGGTHLRSTAEIEGLKLLGTEPMRGDCRLHWLAGRRVRWRLALHEERNAELRMLFETSDEELVTAAAAKLEQLKRAGRRLRALERDLADEVARSLARRGEPVVEAHFEEADGSFLQLVARRFSDLGERQVALLTSSGEKGNFFALAAGGECAIDIDGVGPQVAELLGGRGGGSGRLFQGKAGSWKQRSEVLELLARQLE